MQQGTAMATAFKLLLLLLCSYHSFISHTGATGSLKPAAVCSEAKGIPSTGGATVQLHHRHGPCSPVPSKKVPTLEELLRSDELRASYIQRKFSLAATANRSDDVQPSEVTVPTTLGSSVDTMEYVITVGLGTPAATQTMMIDTGSDVSWVQCQPCSKCHSQVDPLFDPSSSSSYSAFPCSSAACAQLGKDQSNGCSDSQCQYVVHYGDRSKTTGTYSSDTLTLGSDAIKGFQFGCSHAEAGFDDETDGLMGLGGGAQSLVSQTAPTLGDAFSYCLPPPTSTAAGFLTLGAASSTAAGSGFVTTGMHRSSQVPTYYMVRLEGIMVGGKKLSVAPSVFSGGSVMDSGTVVTRLPAAAYSALSSAFRAAMARQYRPAPRRGIFDTCFDLGGQSKPSNVTAVALVFDGGAVVNLDLEGIMVDNCLAFAATDGISIIGNVQQRTFEVLYDVGKSTLGFRAGAC